MNLYFLQTLKLSQVFKGQKATKASRKKGTENRSPAILGTHLLKALALAVCCNHPAFAVQSAVQSHAVAVCPSSVFPNTQV